MKNERSELYKLDKDALSVRYEDLRDEIFQNSRLQGQGSVVFLHQGMIGWIKAWCKWVPSMHKVKEYNEHPSYEQNLSMDLRQQMTVVISNMVMIRWEGCRV